MYPFLDILFFVLHIVTIGFNLVGWIWPKTRKLHLTVVILTLASWLGLGIWFGFGYCFLTDWHWTIKEKLGEADLPNSFVKYFADQITGLDFDPGLIDGITLGAFGVAIGAAIYVNFMRPKVKNRGK